jgi:DNA-binding NarL/FixJ family response regulator
MKIRVLLVDDHRIFRQGLCGLIAEEPDLLVVGEAEDGREALAQVEQLGPDVVVMDVGMPTLNGIEAARQIARQHPRIRIIALSMHTNERFVTEMLRAGATGYLCKKCEADELIQAIRVVAAGQTYLSPAVTGSVVERHVRTPSSPEPGSAFSRLTDREREVLQLLVEERSIKEIASELHVSAKTVHAHREHLAQKLGIQTMAGLIKYALREGLAEL